MGHIWEEPIRAIPLLLKGHILTALVTIFLMWLVYSCCAAVLVAGDKRNDLLAGIILFIVLAFNWTSDLKDAYVAGTATFDSKITNVLLYVCATFPDFMQLVGFGTAIRYRNR